MIGHPFVGDISNKTLEELGETISKLNKQLNYMYQINKVDMVRQIQMVLESYRREYQKKQQEIWDKKSQNLDKKIDIQ
jgi:hypothetical protein